MQNEAPRIVSFGLGGVNRFFALKLCYLMTNKCKKCGVPLEGFMYKWVISKLLDIRPSTKEPGLCNKCEAAPSKPLTDARGQKDIYIES